MRRTRIARSVCIGTRFNRKSGLPFASRGRIWTNWRNRRNRCHWHHWRDGWPGLPLRQSCTLQSRRLRKRMKRLASGTHAAAANVRASAPGAMPLTGTPWPSGPVTAKQSGAGADWRNDPQRTSRTPSARRDRDALPAQAGADASGKFQRVRPVAMQADRVDAYRAIRAL